jgi:hypothetical protein
MKEPGSRGFWLLVAGLVLLCVPYLFVLFLDVSEPRFIGIPAWFYLSVAAALGISVASVQRIVKHWDIENKLP